MLWRDAVIAALDRYSTRHSTRLISRQPLIDEELERICKDTDSHGETPSQTLSRVLQELRNDKIIYFTGSGQYLLADKPIDVEVEDLPDDAIDFALETRKLEFNKVEAGNSQVITRRRKGQNRIRELTLFDYDFQCSLCDIQDKQMLVASHIVRWSDDAECRGNLSNVICLCRLHDPLFELGYFALTDNYEPIYKQAIASQMVTSVVQMTKKFRRPRTNLPAPEFLKRHRIRTGFDKP